MDLEDRESVIREFYGAIASEWPQSIPAGGKISNLKVFGYIMEIDLPPVQATVDAKGSSATTVVT